jgi:hypothetical protein
MKYLLTVVAILFSLANSASASETKNVFSCIDQATLTVNENCLSSTIELEQKLDQFTNKLNKFEVRNAYLDTGFEMATLAYYPELNLIRVIADRPEKAKQQLQTAMIND